MRNREISSRLWPVRRAHHGDLDALVAQSTTTLPLIASAGELDVTAAPLFAREPGSAGIDRRAAA